MLSDKFKNNKGVVFSLVILLLVCCKGREDVKLVEGFPSEYDLKATGIDSLNRYPGAYAISMVGDKFIGMRKADHFFFALNNDFSLISEIAAKGHGNGEFMAPLYCIIRKSKFPQNPKRSVRFSGKRTKRSVQKRKARNTQKAETKVL